MRMSTRSRSSCAIASRTPPTVWQKTSRWSWNAKWRNFSANWRRQLARFAAEGVVDANEASTSTIPGLSSRADWGIAIRVAGADCNAAIVLQGLDLAVGRSALSNLESKRNDFVPLMSAVAERVLVQRGIASSCAGLEACADATNVCVFCVPVPAGGPAPGGTPTTQA